MRHVLLVLVALAEAGDKDEYEDWWPRPGIQDTDTDNFKLINII